LVDVEYIPHQSANQKIEDKICGGVGFL